MTEKVNQECSSITANELADKLETEDCCTLDMEAVADMLRQQATEIEELKIAKKVILRYAEEDIAKYKAEIKLLKKEK